MKPLIKEKIGLYANADYLNRYGIPQTIEDLTNHRIISFNATQEKDSWAHSNDQHILLRPAFTCNDIEGSLNLVINGEGIGRFTELNVCDAVSQKQLNPVLPEINWGEYYLFAIYPQQKSLPQRTRLLLDCIEIHTRNI